MAHLALYRKYRPSGFDHLLGQDHIKKTLLNAINQDSISHAYLFSGPRGTGKTSTAKIFAKAINCKSIVNGEPCGTCDICSDGNPDIIEIDAASNNGVEEIRELRDKIGYTPAFSDYKVYIIDEVHMLTTGAFNALLKTLEEPPKHAIFILATTEPHKIPLTILSRLQRFDFKRITDTTLVERMKYILEQENVEYEPAALNVIARVADGGMRDALSLLDQVLAHSNGKINLNDVIELTGTVDLAKIGAVVQAIDNKDTSLMLDLLDQMIEVGKEPKFLLDDLLSYYRDLLVYNRVGEGANLTKVITDASFKTIASQISTERIYSIIDILSKCQNQIKYSGQDKVILEVALIKTTADNPVDEILILKAEVEKLKRIVTNGQFVVSDQQAATSSKEEILKEEPSHRETNLIDSKIGEKVAEVSIGLDEISSIVESSNQSNENVNKPKIIDDPQEAFIRQMAGENVIAAADMFPREKPKDMKQELIDMSFNKNQVDNEENQQSKQEITTLQEIQDRPSDSANENESILENQEIQSPLENEALTFLDQLEDDIKKGAAYIEVVDDNGFPASDDLAPPLTEEDPSSFVSQEQPVSVSPKQPVSEKNQKVMDILAEAKKEYRMEYLEKEEQVHSILKQERMSVLSLFREAAVIAVSNSKIVVAMKAKPQVKMLEKVSNRSIVQGVLAEVFGRSLELVVLDEKEWLEIKNNFVKN
ncbi:DNA polymerase III subunit gamma/tau [Metabacillus fastidiosus]|uniref:DNA-directed DNA polymerase n=1 Tax=Metabacillus fastidiosus TaxID=1458 RepID=A0ABU6NTD4_9BACI|nr:DNA polymerase III subunit gamma/tau [Metabacillus fastidiosus]